MRATRTLTDANVLVWFDEGIAYRLELRGGRGEALRIAHSLR